MADGKLGIELIGDNSSLMAAIDKATKGIESFSKEAKKNVGEIDGTFEKLAGSFGAIKSAIGGLAIFGMMKHSIDAAVELGAEVRRLSSYFGISGERAGELAEALKRLGSTPDEFISMSNKLVKNLEKNAPVFEAYGILTKKIGTDGQVEWKKQIDIATDAGAVLNGIEGPTERAAAALKMFGRSGGEAATYFRRLAEEAENSKQNIAAMGVVIDYDHLATESKKYVKAQKDITQTFNIMKIVAGQELLPSLLDLTRFFSSILTPAVEGAGWIIKGLTSYFWAFKGVIETVISGVTDFVLKIGNGFSGVMDIVQAAIEGRYKEIPGIWKKVQAQHIQIDQETEKIREGISEDFWKKQEEIWNRPHKKSEEDDGTGGKVKAHKFTPEEEKALENQMKAELEALRRKRAGELFIDADFFKLSEAETLAHWRKMSAAHHESANVENFIQKEVTTARIANAKDVEARWKRELDKGLAENADNFNEQIILAEIYLGRIETNHKKGSAEYLAAEKTLADIRNKAKADRKKYNDEVEAGERAHQVATIGLEIEGIKILQAQGKISDEDALRRTITLNEKLYQEERKALARRLALDDLKPVEVKKVLNQIQALEDGAGKRRLTDEEHLRKELEKKSAWAGMKAAATDYVRAAENNFKNFGGAVTKIMSAAENSISTAIQGLIKGQMTLGEAMKSIWVGIADAVLGAVSQMVAQWIVAQAAAMIFGVVQEKVENTKAAAALDTGAAEAWAAYGWMPFVGPGLAMAQIAAMEASFLAAKVANRAATAYATGGLVSSPQLGLVGEAGSEYIVPEKSMASLIPGLMESGARIYSAIAASKARTYRPVTNSSQTLTTRTTNNAGHTINISGVIGDKRQLGTYLKSVINDHTLIYGSAL